jgi:hypothetical protein
VRPLKVCVGCGKDIPNGPFASCYSKDGIALPDGDRSQTEPWHVQCTHAAWIAEQDHAKAREILRAHGIPLTGEMRFRWPRAPLAYRQLRTEIYAALLDEKAIR